MEINKDAFSNGQIDSKIWLCEELEKTGWQSSLTHIYGGWYGITAFLLLSKNRFRVEKIRSFDIDPTCQPIADCINENWVIKDWKFKAFTMDCNELQDKNCDLVINTSTEHFKVKDWFFNIPKGTRIILQGNNMSHEDHHVYSKNLKDFIDEYPLSDYTYTGEKDFYYPKWNFKRFMILGIR